MFALDFWLDSSYIMQSKQVGLWGYLHYEKQAERKP